MKGGKRVSMETKKSPEGKPGKKAKIFDFLSVACLIIGLVYFILRDFDSYQNFAIAALLLSNSALRAD